MESYRTDCIVVVGDACVVAHPRDGPAGPASQPGRPEQGLSRFTQGGVSPSITPPTIAGLVQRPGLGLPSRREGFDSPDPLYPAPEAEADEARDCKFRLRGFESVLVLHSLEELGWKNARAGRHAFAFSDPTPARPADGQAS